jgi:hypothetical protein
VEEIGLEGERLGMFFMSGSQAQAFAAAAHTMTERIRKLGPNPLKASSNGHEQSQAPELIIIDEDVGFRGRRLD